MDLFTLSVTTDQRRVWRERTIAIHGYVKSDRDNLTSQQLNVLAAL